MPATALRNKATLAFFGVTLAVLVGITYFGNVLFSSGSNSARREELPERPSADTDFKPRILTEIPTGLSLSAAVMFPDSKVLGELQEFSLNLYRARTPSKDSALPKGADLAIFRRVEPVSQSHPAGISALGRIGPGGIQGYRNVGKHGKETLLASRTLSEERLQEFAKLPAKNLDALIRNNFTAVARQETTTVPGIGSLPVSPTRRGNVISYVGTGHNIDSGEFQRSIALGAYTGSSSDIAVMDWWFERRSDVESRPEGRRYTFPAYAVAKGTAETAPSADLTVWKDGTEIVLVRTVGIEETDAPRIFDSVKPITMGKWKSLIRPINPAQREIVTIARSKNSKYPWEATLTQGSPGSREFCLKALSGAKAMSCILVDTLVPSPEKKIGATGSLQSEPGKRGWTYAFGIVSADVSQVSVSGPRQAAIRAQLFTIEPGAKLFVAVLPPSTRTLEINAVGEGEEERVPLVVGEADDR